MKRNFFLLAAAALMLATPSCKKGENDPGLSLKSRKARISGTWDVSGYTQTTRNDEVDGDYQEVSSSLSGDVITTTSTSYDAASSTSSSVVATTTLDKAQYEINKDGTWTREWNTTTVLTETDTDFFSGDEHTITTTTVTTSTMSGNWSFLGKVKEGTQTYANKERIVVNVLNSTSTSSEKVVDVNTTQSTTTETDNGSNTSNQNYYSGEMAMTYAIDQLKGKEMVWVVEESNSGTWSSTVGSTTTTNTNDTYSSDETWTFTAVK